MLRKKMHLLLLLPIFLFSLSSCLSLPENSGSDEFAQDETASDDAMPEGGADSGSDEFAEFEDKPAVAAADEANSAPSDSQAAVTEAPSAEATPQATANLEDEFNLDDTTGADLAANSGTPQEALPIEEAPQEKTATLEDDLELSLDDPASPTSQAQAETPIETPAITETPVEPAPTQIQSAATPPTTLSSAPMTEIKSVQFKAHDNGGTLIIQGDKPLTFSTRKNPETNQLILEVNNANLPDKFKRPLNMRDMQGAIGAVDAYQEAGSTTARFVVQIRNGASQPFVVTEGSTLLVVADVVPQVASVLQGETFQKDLSAKSTPSSESNPDRVLTSRTLQEFLAGNTKFYGKRISLETNSMPVREALRFISEEGGVNMIIADNIQGNVSLKLRDVPWDQAFIVIMKSKDLGYVRQGNVLRVATIADLRKEEEDTINLTTARLKVEPLVVKVFPINYAKVDELGARVKDFLTERGKVAGDVRTNSVVVTDIPQNLDRISQLIQSLDTQPPQVLIEGRIIEATDDFQRQVGINWGFDGRSYRLGKSNEGDISLRPSLGISTGTGYANQMNLQIGSFDILGDISALISMNELESKIRVLSSPRIVTLSNEKATINQSMQVPITTSQPVGGFIIPKVDFKSLDLKLEVTPQITSNASVIMNISVKRDVQGAAVGDQFAIESREAATKVMVKNGQTSIIGGVYQNDTNETVVGVPILKDIPLLGSLFRSKDNKHRRTELMIFLTPRIVAAGFSAPEDTEATRIGSAIGSQEGATNANQ